MRTRQVQWRNRNGGCVGRFFYFSFFFAFTTCFCPVWVAFPYITCTSFLLVRPTFFYPISNFLGILHVVSTWLFQQAFAIFALKLFSISISHSQSVSHSVSQTFRTFADCSSIISSIRNAVEPAEACSCLIFLLLCCTPFTPFSSLFQLCFVAFFSQCPWRFNMI